MKNRNFNRILLISGFLVLSSVTTAFAENIINKDNPELTTDDIAIEYIENDLLIEVLDDFTLSTEGITNDNNINLRSEPTIKGTLVAQVPKDTTLVIVGKEGEWVEVIYNDELLYVHNEHIDASLIEPILQEKRDSMEIIPKYAHVTNEDGVYVKTAPEYTGEVLEFIPYDSYIDVIDDTKEWDMVVVGSNIGYVKDEFIEVFEGEKPIIANNNKATDIIEYAKQFLGTPYSWGGTNLTRGVDCSGFVYQVMKDNGINLNRSSRDQIYNGTIVSKDELLTGDLVFFDTNGGSNTGNISHVGIYIGDNKFIHASSSRNTPYVTINSLSDDYYIRTYVSAARVL